MIYNGEDRCGLAPSISISGQLKKKRKKKSTVMGEFAF
jgi:hypothetical protein